MNEAVAAGGYEEALLEAGLPPGSRCAHRRLPSGLRIVAAEVPEARQLRLVGAVGVGYLDEPADCRGLVHLLEHGLFLGSASTPGEGDFAAWVGDQGGRYNARTDESVTDVHLHLPPEAADAGLRRLVDLLGRPRLDPEPLAREVDVLEAEFRARLADPALHRLAALGRLFRPDHPARYCHAGHRGTLDDTPRGLAARLTAFHRRHYRTEWMALAMLGPLPLEEQLALLARHGARLPCGGSPPAPSAWRWRDPAALAWCPPTPSPPGSGTLLELIWPLPDAVARAGRRELGALAARLADGQLAARLQAMTALQDLAVDLAPEGTGPALAMRLTLAEPAPDLAALLAVCLPAPARALGEPLPPPPCPSIDLDAWPRRQACRLAADATSPADALPLAHWLAVEQCRILWRAPEADAAWSTRAETGTRWRPLALPVSTPVAESSGHLPPSLPLSLEPAPAPSSAKRASPGCLRHDAPLTLWWGGPAWSRPTGGACWCLGWAADPAGQEARLKRWHRRTLALRQAAASRGLDLTLAADAAGDWLMARGDPRRIASLVAQALAVWSTEPGDADASAPPQGLLARALLRQLEFGAARGEPGPRLLGWASGELGQRQAARDAERFAEILAAPPDASPATAASMETSVATSGASWLPPQGEERAVMLEVRGADASPRSRWLLKLLAACHDAAFQHEMRQRHGFGYVAAVRYAEAAGWPRLGYVVQSPWASVTELQRAIVDFLVRRGEALARPDEGELARLRCGMLARHGAPETHREAIERTWQALRRHPAGPDDWLAPWATERRALAGLEVIDLALQGRALADATLPRHWWCHTPSV
ncbi:insulinase family protein [Halomonas alkalicola]|uniref:insulinase family protein n=1 Tax=Halomonas alkalicola TaxID=1930622 RepID=UPI00265EA16D|nr:insulinase family protein [Halomonas alkalicola]